MLCHCKKCDTVTKHCETDKTQTRFRCQVCGMERFYAESYGAGDFPELTHDQNEVIHEARIRGFAVCFPCFPTAKAQAENTFAAAEKYLQRQ